MYLKGAVQKALPIEHIHFGLTLTLNPNPNPTHFGLSLDSKGLGSRRFALPDGNPVEEVGPVGQRHQLIELELRLHLRL